MRKLVAGFAASLDGYIAGPNGEYDWILIDKDMDFAAMTARFDTYFYGRKTYEVVNPKGKKAGKGMSHFVFSRSMEKVPEGYTLIRSDVGPKVTALKQQDGKDIAVFGGAGLLASLLQLQLVDEISVALVPVLLGEGKPMVDKMREKAWLQLAETKTYGNGTVQLTYQVKRQ